MPVVVRRHFAQGALDVRRGSADRQGKEGPRVGRKPVPIFAKVAVFTV
jgi:hypothetical protein